MTKQTKAFKTEVQQLLDLVIHSLYSKKEIFLRELISNASDAIDKARFLGLSDQTILTEDSDWKIRLAVDKAARTITLTDNGVGMNAEEVENNIGTIANSGTRRFLEELRKTDTANLPELIGQFGVGFYSSFMVAERVVVTTRRAGAAADQAVRWESTGDGNYTLEPATRASRGTEVVLHLREGLDEFSEEYRLRKIVKQYSDYVAYPITLMVEREQPKKDAEGKEIEGESEKTVTEETINSMKAIWKRSKTEVKPEEYAEFYKHISHDFTEPLKTIHFNAEGATEFSALLYLPRKSPWGFFQREDQRKGVHLYVRNVFITDDCRELLPEYLGFVRGVVDSSDLPLNVSRELLQDDAIIRRIGKSLVGKVLNTLGEMKDKERAEYLGFYKEFGRLIKGGLHSDFPNLDKLKELLFFETSKTGDGELSSLKEYRTRMTPDQQAIYYLAAEDRATALRSPHLERFREKELEVLLLTDPIDDFVIQDLAEYDGKKLVDIGKGEVELETDPERQKQHKEEKAKALESLKPLLSYLEAQLKDLVKEVRLSSRLTDSACVLVADEHGMTARMERFYKSFNQDLPSVKRILELNPKHPVVSQMAAFLAKDAAHPRLADYAELLASEALLAEGQPPRQPVKYAQLVRELLVSQGQRELGDSPAPAAAAAEPAAPAASDKA